MRKFHAQSFSPDSPFSPDSAHVAFVAPSPNHGERRCGRPDSLVLHYTGMPTAEGALARLCDPTAEVSSHYLVYEDGRIAQLVPEDRRAWHAGRSAWHGQTDMNSASIGVEIANPGHDGGAPPFPEAQIEATIKLCADIFTRHAIAADRLLAHSDIAPGRKIDPGEKFPWARLARSGVGRWISPAPLEDGPVLALGAGGPPVLALQKDLAAIGYAIETTGQFDAATQIVVAAFQRRWRPILIDGRADLSTRETLHALLLAQGAA